MIDHSVFLADIETWIIQLSKGSDAIKTISSSSQYLKYPLGLSALLCATLLSAASPQEIKKMVGAEEAAFLDTLKTLINIESGSKDLEGLNQMAKV